MKKVISALFTLCTLFILFTACKKDKNLPAGFVDDQLFLNSEKQNMPIRVSGNIGSGKLLLIVHGGPGGSALDYRSEYVVKTVEQKLGVVYWDQRYAGGSQGNGGTAAIEQFHADLKKVIQLMRHKYGQHQKIYLMGHSWGGFLAPDFLAEGDNQKLISGLIEVDGAVDPRLGDYTQRALLDMANLELAVGRNNEFWKEVQDYCLNKYNGDYVTTSKLNQFAHQAEEHLKHLKPNEPEYKIADGTHAPIVANLIGLFISGIQGIFEDAFDHRSLVKKLPNVKLPVLMLWGRYDMVCPTELMILFESHVGANDVEKKIFEQSFHSPMINEPTLYWFTVLDWIERHQ